MKLFPISSQVYTIESDKSSVIDQSHFKILVTVLIFRKSVSALLTLYLRC